MSQWKAVDVWQHMYAAVEDQNGVEVARVYRPDRLLIAEQIAQAYNAQAERAALEQEEDALRAAMQQIVDGPCLPHCDTQTGAPCSCWYDVARAALTPARPGDVGATDGR